MLNAYEEVLLRRIIARKNPPTIGDMESEIVEAGWSRNTFYKHLKGLEKKEIIRREKMRRNGVFISTSIVVLKNLEEALNVERSELDWELR